MRPTRIGANVAVGYAGEAIDADGDERVGDRAEVSTVGLVLVVVVNELVEVMVRLYVIVLHALTIRVHLAEFPARNRFAAFGCIGESGD